MSVAQKALWIIERNSARELTLAELAANTGVSRSHLANAFASATGLSVMRYLRGRRLTEAAHALADGAKEILGVALDAGYGSHEAFTRAFKEQFGATPEAVRGRKSTRDLALVEALDCRAPHTRPTPPDIVRGDAIRAVGMTGAVTFETTTKVIPALWQRFGPYMGAVPARMERMPVGIADPADDTGAFAYTCALEVARFADTPKDLREIEIPARTYAKFEHRGHVSGLDDTYLAIWNDMLPALGRPVADAPVIERHNPEFDPHTGEGGVTIWIPLDA